MEPVPQKSKAPLAHIARIPAPLAIDVAWDNWTATLSCKEFDIFLLGSGAEHSVKLVRALEGGLGNHIRLLRSERGSAVRWLTADEPYPTMEDRSEQVRIYLRTPLRLVASGKALEFFDLKTFVRNLCLRVAVWGHYFERMSWPAPWKFLDAQVEQVRWTATNIRSVRFVRFSSRQRRRILMTGLLGSISLYQVPPALLLLFRAGEICGVGKGATIGLGRISVEELA